jgi:hypothetical protein
MMSDRLAVSATFSVLMMATYVLFGNDAVRLPPDSEQPSPSYEAAAAWLASKPLQLFASAR